MRGCKVIGRLGPTNLKPLPEAVAWEIVTVDLPSLTTAMGLIRLLPTATLPKLALETLISLSAAAVPAMDMMERRRRLQYTGLSGDPRRFMLSLSLRVLNEHGGGLWSFGCARNKFESRTNVFILYLRKSPW